MHIEQTGIPGLVILTPARFGDARGFFSETWNRARLSENGIEIDFVQDNHSLSAAVGTVRGLHFQAPPHGQAKLVRCGRGALFDVAVDIRKGSPTYGRWFGIELTFENGKQLMIPAGFAHGFATRQPDTEIIYKCSDTYAPETEGALRYDDPDIGIDWGLGETQAILSDKDAAAGAFAGFESPFVYEGSST
jgi:dTDP-4-dehydrorhamnose 3,5-epimerase